jgi:FMN-dependent oxidoreductase (nitrilotriacetate monooxygenase family)
MRSDKMVLASFATASATKAGHSAWTHEATELRFLDVQYYAKLARAAEDAGFDLIFFDDRLAMPTAYTGSPSPAVERGSRVIKLDVAAILGALSIVTSRIGLGATYSTTYHQPYHIARVFATIDHLSGGRAIWNIVTSLNNDEARNFGLSDHPTPQERYSRADEFLEVVTGLWESWEPDALVYDRECGVFARPEAVSRLSYRGSRYSSEGPLTVPRPPQGWPILLQAGQSGPGMAFAAKWADITFSAPPALSRAIEQYANYKELAVRGGRRPEDIRILPSVQAIVGETPEIARDKVAYVDSLFDPVETLISMSEYTNVDFGQFALDQKLTDEVLGSVTGSKGIFEAQLAGAREYFGEDVTPLQVAEFVAMAPGTRFVGTGAQVAEDMANWFHSSACDGFVITPISSPGDVEAFGRLAMPHLRRLGVVGDPAQDSPRMFRDRAGLPRRDHVKAAA